MVVECLASKTKSATPMKERNKGREGEEAGHQGEREKGQKSEA